jgi:urea transport system substrate-binding protein
MNPGMNSIEKKLSRRLGRREWLKMGVAAAAAAPAGACRRVAGPDPIKVGILHSQTGTMAISEVSLRDVELFAIDEINRAGGILGRPVEAIVEDPRSNLNNLFPRRARKLLEEDRVSVVFGCWTSRARKAVLPVMEELNGLLFYPLQYEGNESSRSIVYLGSTPNQQILPAIDWLRSAAGGGKRRFFLVGSDYVFPRTASYIIARHLEATVPDATIVGTRYEPLGAKDFGGVVAAIKSAEADVVVNMINGDSNVAFFNELAKQGMAASAVPVLSTSVAEDELRSFLPGVVEGHLAAWSYFQTLRDPRNREFVRRYQEEYGVERVLDDPMVSAYCAVHLWKQAVEVAGSPEPDAVRAALARSIEFSGPGGPIRIDPKTHHAYKRCRIGRIRSDLQFDVLHESSRAIPPDPYPPDAFPGWKCDWTKNGLVAGAPVRI